MDPISRIKLELDIEGQKMVSQMMVHNIHLEEQINQGIKLAVDDLLKDNNLAEKVRDEAKKSLYQVINKAVMSYEVQLSIQKAISEKIGFKISEYADSVAEKIAQSLK